MLLTRIHGKDIEPLLLTRTHCIDSVLLNHTHTRGPSVPRMQIFLISTLVTKSYYPLENTQPRQMKQTKEQLNNLIRLILSNQRLKHISSFWAINREARRQVRKAMVRLWVQCPPQWAGCGVRPRECRPAQIQWDPTVAEGVWEIHHQ